MTPKQKARLDYHNYEAGIAHGESIARSIIERFPDGFSDQQCTTLTADIEASRQSALEAIPNRFKESFSAGYYLGIKTAIKQYQETLIKRAIG